jgi:DNA-binding transcriptional ArsR family regulator
LFSHLGAVHRSYFLRCTAFFFSHDVFDFSSVERKRIPVLDFVKPVSILNFMVKFNEALLDRTFAALSDPTRRALLVRLSEHELSVSELAAPLAMSLPAVMKHLDVLSGAGLITRSKTGRTVACRLAAGPMEDAMQWLHRYQRFWSGSLDRLAAFVEEEPAPCPPNPVRSSSPASPSSVASPPRPPKSSVRGRTRRNS